MFYTYDSINAEVAYRREELRRSFGQRGLRARARRAMRRGPAAVSSVDRASASTTQPRHIPEQGTSTQHDRASSATTSTSSATCQARPGRRRDARAHTPERTTAA
ncbi:hypothetical protein [Phytoactinopolyspora limicola]|uniref:hypothetical protein n=1 Tax=Phytoactinopolyspora limicola TaxID=2715536 RepID=UPI00140D25F2|nr:hypothetical protein [Phytoactinopolyspora limicola]